MPEFTDELAREFNRAMKAVRAEFNHILWGDSQIRPNGLSSWSGECPIPVTTERTERQTAGDSAMPCDTSCDECYPGEVEEEDEDYESDDYESYDDDDDVMSQSDEINDYGYKPDPIFFHSGIESQLRATPGVPYMGMELEITTDDIARHASALVRYHDDYLYLKEDSSVRGFEMVTHPMTLEAAPSVIPFAQLEQLIAEGATGEDNGIHVHVSRSGFDNDLHVFKWMKLLYRNADEVQGIARRENNSYARFTEQERKQQKWLAEKEYGRKSQSQRARNQRDRYGERIGVFPERYSAINSQNEHTFEVRIFRGSLHRNEIMASLELVHASVEYTRQLTAADVLTCSGWTWEAFMLWTQMQGKKYVNLVAYNRAIADVARIKKAEAAAATKRSEAYESVYAEANRIVEEARTAQRAMVSAIETAHNAESLRSRQTIQQAETDARQRAAVLAQQLLEEN